MNKSYGGNIEFKKQFMDDLIGKSNYSESTQRNMDNLLRTAKFYEDLYGKDLYSFTFSDVVHMLKSQRVKTLNALRQRASMYSMYVQYAVDQGYAYSNVIKQFTLEDYESIVDMEATNQRYITRKELFDNLLALINAQDQVIFALLFDGVMGKDYENLVNLKINDIRKDTLITSLYDGSIVTLSNDTYNLIMLADSEDTYDSYSGKSYHVVKNEYVLRACKRKRGEEYEPLKSSAIRSKLDQFKKIIGMSGLTGRSVYLSGVAERYINERDSRRRVDVESWLSINGVNTNATEMCDIIEIIENKRLSEVDE